MSEIYIPNPLFEQELRHSAELNLVITSQAEATALVAQALAPVETGRLAASISAGPSDNGEAEVTADTPYAAFVEFGTVNMAPNPFLANALEVATLG